MSRYLFAVVVLSSSLGLAYWILRRPFREIVEEVNFERARKRFRHHRELLELRFVSILELIDEDEASRWDDAVWSPEVVWARDRKTRLLIALVGVQFPPPLFSEEEPTQVTALFEFHETGWTTNGQWYDSMRPDEAVLHHDRLEYVVGPRQRISPTGDAAF